VARRSWWPGLLKCTPEAVASSADASWYTQEPDVIHQSDCHCIGPHPPTQQAPHPLQLVDSKLPDVVRGTAASALCRLLRCRPACLPPLLDLGNFDTIVGGAAAEVEGWVPAGAVISRVGGHVLCVEGRVGVPTALDRGTDKPGSALAGLLLTNMHLCLLWGLQA
jgi:hypothetical protein